MKICPGICIEFIFWLLKWNMYMKKHLKWNMCTKKHESCWLQSFFLYRTRHMRHFALPVLCALNYWIAMTQFASDNAQPTSLVPHIFDGIFSLRNSKPTWETCSWVYRMKIRRVLGLLKAFSRHSNRVDVEILELFPGQKIAQKERPARNCSL